jgi:anti-sigma factor RsiW
MSNAMLCQRAEELFSDHHEANLAEPLRSELERHLEECEDCRRLHQALAEVVEALRSDPAVEPPAGLAARAATAALARARPTRRPGSGRGSPGWRRSVSTLPIAATLILGLSTAFVAGSSTPRPLGIPERWTQRTQNAREYLLERTECLVEDVRILRVEIATAFEGRLDRVNARLDDYRRLLEEKREVEGHRQGRGGGGSSRLRVVSAEGSTSFRNRTEGESVVAGVAPAADRG